MNKLLLPLMGIASLGLSACVVNIGDHEANWDEKESWQLQQQQNQQQLAKLTLGMDQQQVQHLMGQADFNEAFLSNEQQVQVLFYRTRHRHSDGKTTKDECTPLVFRDQQLIGWGDKAYAQL
ncbi:DUF3192 domain-containing protein [Shewanella chilikensis]|uniref:DUF3192 domain-containing protein n=1 Tax=Shewanella chilikensis TaxID=558541 RepID=UPI001F3AD834|nr:DUF3192 domain-containing protein [Shewanella chilikensis]MCE9787265.1 DUF3192 domain-containing protein [Shewanella chilikensis]